MKCTNCGYENDTNVPYCYNCGQKLEYNNQQNLNNPNDGSNQQYSNNPNDAYQQNYDNGSNPNQQQYYPNQADNYPNVSTNHKNMVISLILAIIPPFFISFLCGIGHFYLGLRKRLYIWIGSVVVLFIFNLIAVLSGFDVLSDIAYILLIILWLYSIYDTYVCTNAINKNEKVPLLFNIEGTDVINEFF